MHKIITINEGLLRLKLVLMKIINLNMLFLIFLSEDWLEQVSNAVDNGVI